MKNLFLTIVFLLSIFTLNAQKSTTYATKWEANTLNGKYIGVALNYLDALNTIQKISLLNKNTDNRILDHRILYTKIEGTNERKVYYEFLSKIESRELEFKFLTKDDLAVMRMIFKNNDVEEAIKLYKKSHKVSKKKTLAAIQSNILSYSKYLLDSSYSDNKVLVYSIK